MYLCRLNQPSEFYMDKQQGIGFLLLFVLLVAWYFVTAPSAEEIARQQQIQDSIQLVQAQQTELPEEAKEEINALQNEKAAISSIQADPAPAEADTTIVEEKPAAKQVSSLHTIENEKLKITFDSKGGVIKEAILKDYEKWELTEDKSTNKLPLKLMEDKKNRFEYLLPTNGSGQVSTQDLYFEVQEIDKGITFTAQTNTGASIQQTYKFVDDYLLDYNVDFKEANKLFQAGTQSIKFRWHQYLDKIEQNVNFEKYYSSVYFKAKDEDSDYCNCRSDDEESLDADNIHWISHVNQFFNSSIIAKNANMQNGQFETKVLEDSDDLKLIKSSVDLPINGGVNESLAFQMYLGPNEFNELRTYEIGLEEVIPFGNSIFGSINRWIIRPSFDFLSKYIGSKGVVIIILIFLLKMLLYPLMFKMLKSQAKMGALKPEIAKIKEKFPDDQQKVQMETMKMYREYGTSPLGGCMPMLLQMPIWYALFRFFPASIRFRQESFLWAQDLSSYDVISYLPFEIPAFGSHLSLFTILWALSTIAYTYYNTKHMDMSANPAMKYVQYAMPIMFLVFFNNYASGLTCYMFFSNLINVAQTIITKKFVFNDDKIRAELMKEKDKPKKSKSGFQARLEEAMKQQQEVQKKRNQQAANQKKKKRK